MPFHYDPDDMEVLRLQTAGRCAEFDKLCGRLKDHTLELDDLKPDFERLHQPDAVALAEAWSHHLSDNDPRFIYVERIGNVRRVDLSDMRTLKAPLAASSETAIVQFQTIASILRKLADSVTEPSDN